MSRTKGKLQKSTATVVATLRVECPPGMEKAVLAATLPDPRESRVKVELDEEDWIVLTVSKVSLADARSIINTHLRLLKTAIESIRATK